MTMKRHAILLTTGIVVLVFLCLTFAKVAGCKDEEVLTWSKTDEEPPEAVYYYDGEKTHLYLLKPKSEIIIMEDKLIRMTQGYVGETYIDEPELNEPEPYSFVGFAMGVKTVVPPVTCFNCNREYQVDKNCVEMDFYCDCGQHIIIFGVTNKYPPEPTEPTILPNRSIMLDFDTDGPGVVSYGDVEISLSKPIKLTNYIPTWPDYIELEKQLIILYPKYKLEPGIWNVDVNGVQIYEYQPKEIIPKGTKIYFKED